MITRSTGLLLLCLGAGTAGAHPHGYIDQQVLLSVGTGEVTVQIRIAPSYTDGAAIFAHIDVDGDGAVSESEAKRFGSDVIAGASLNIDGRRFDFGLPSVFVPELEWVSAGIGLIEVDATAAVNLAARAPHRVSLHMRYDDFSDEWSIQPFYYPELASVLETKFIERNPGGTEIEIGLAP